MARETQSPRDFCDRDHVVAFRPRDILGLTAAELESRAGVATARRVGPGCFSLGRLYESRDAADAGPHSSKRAIDAYERGCRGAHEDSCRRVPPFTLDSEAWLDESFVILTPGQHLLLECELDGALIRRLRRVATMERPDRTIEVQLAEVPDIGRSSAMLTIKNPFSKGLKYEAAVQLRGMDTFMRTSTLPVRAGLTNHESWPNPMARVVLSDFRLAR